MILGAISPKSDKDRRSTLHPNSIKPLKDMGIEIFFERGLGEGIDVSDEEMQKNGAQPASREDCLSRSDVIFSSEPISSDEIARIKKNALVVGLLEPFSEKEQLHNFAKANVSALSMEFIPRITKAQKMDVLSSQSNLAGYVSVIESAKHLKSALPMMMTAAGTLKPATVFVIGVGVAGLQAIATAKRLGAKVEAFDTRPVVEEQVKSLGAKFVKIDLGDTGQTEQGYAQELTEEQIKKQKDLQSEVCSKSDIVITTAQLFGRPAPRLIDSATIKKMKPGSVIFDMAVESGGNVEGSVPDEIVETNGVKIIGLTNLASYVADHASYALSNNLVNFITDFYDQEKKSMNLDMSDEIISSALLVQNGEVIKEMFK